jgi:hypothetical protein
MILYLIINVAAFGTMVPLFWMVNIRRAQTAGVSAAEIKRLLLFSHLASLALVAALGIAYWQLKAFDSILWGRAGSVYLVVILSLVFAGLAAILGFGRISGRVHQLTHRRSKRVGAPYEHAK